MTNKINSIGFGNEKIIKFSEGLIATGALLVLSGLMISHSKLEWFTGRDQHTVDSIVDLYNHINV